MKLHPRFVIFVAVSRYLSEEELKQFKDDLAKANPKQDRKFLSFVQKHFDFERMKDAPVVWQDIWIYNYLQYDVKGKFPRKGLIAKYESEITLPLVQQFQEILSLLS